MTSPAKSELTPLAQKILAETQSWFREKIVDAHKSNILGLSSASAFDINPFLAPYVSVALTGTISAEGIARGLVFGRALVTSLNTSFGTQFQNFLPTLMKTVLGSATTGIDIEFDDCVDGQHKWAQIKAGPNTINNGDVGGIHEEFQRIKRKARKDGLALTDHQLVIGIFYGQESDINGSYKKLRDDHNYPILTGNDLWEHITGEKDLQDQFIEACGKAAQSAEVRELLEVVIAQLALDPIIVDMVP
jgi:hypothetical protein